MAAAACVDPPPNCSHSNIIFVNVDISKVLATFFVNLEARAVGNHLLTLIVRQNPYSQRPVWGIIVVFLKN